MATSSSLRSGVGQSGGVCGGWRAVPGPISERLTTSSLHPRPGLPFVPPFVSGIELLVKEMAGEQTCAGRKKKHAALRKAVPSGPRSLCATASVQTLRSLTFYNPSVGPGGSNTLAGPELPPSCYRSRSSFLLKLWGRWLNLNGLQHSRGVCEVTSWSHKNWMRATVLGKSQQC